MKSTPEMAAEPLLDRIHEAVLEFTDGHNLITLNGMYRWMDLGTPGTFLNRLQPYVLAGLGIAYPHVEVTIEYRRDQVTTDARPGKNRFDQHLAADGEPDHEG